MVAWNKIEQGRCSLEEFSMTLHLRVVEVRNVEESRVETQENVKDV